MRILHVNLAGRGIGRYGLLYGRALSRRKGVTALSVFNSELLEADFLREQLDGADHAPLAWSHGNKAARLIELARIAAAFKPDVIHDSGGCYARSLPVWIALRPYGRLMLTEHDPMPHVGHAMSLAERTARGVMPRIMSHVFVHGPRCRDVLIDRGLPPDRISGIRHGHLGMFDRGAYADVVRRDRDILFFGELRYNKGADLLVDIADRVVDRFPDARFIVAGSPGGARRENSWSERLRGLLTDMKRRPHFEVHDRFIPDEEVEYFFRRSGITVMPYREATQSGIAMIAMPLGSVIVATRVGDIPDVVHDGRTGFLAEPTAQSVSRRIIDVLEDPEHVRQVASTARDYVSRECSWATVAEIVVEQCRSICPRQALSEAERSKKSPAKRAAPARQHTD